MTANHTTAMTAYRDRHGTDFDEIDDAMKAASGWQKIALRAQTERDEARAALHQMTHDAVGAEMERDELRAALIAEQRLTAELQARIEHLQEAGWKEAHAGMYADMNAQAEIAQLRAALTQLVKELDRLANDHPQWKDSPMRDDCIAALK